MGWKIVKCRSRVERSAPIICSTDWPLVWPKGEKRLMESIVENRPIFNRVAEKIASAVLNGRDSRAVANYMLEKAAADGRRLTVMHLLKLVYIAHGFRMGMTGRPLIRHPVEAWALGPVIPRIYEEFRPGTLEVFGLIEDSSGVPHSADFTDSERETMDMVYEVYSPLSARQLSDITHEPGAPWDQVKGEGHFAVIPNKIIGDYYRGLIEDAKGRPA